jgi:signal transduction histidine kinase/CheY-like chemotaxis protein
MKLFALPLLALAYVLLGKLGLLLAVPPGYATAVFLPAGLAVAAMLVGGPMTLPWTFAGSLLLNLWEGYGLRTGLDWTAAAIALVIAAASALQAGITGSALKRALGMPVALDKGGDLVRFVLLSPLCCLISVTLSHVGMLILGTVHGTELATSWLTWWVGDTLGVLLMTPLVLVLMGEPRALWRGRAFPVALPMLLFFALFVAIFGRVSAWEADQSLLEYRLLSQRVTDEIEAGLDEQATFLDQLARFFVEGAPVSRDSFHRFVENLPQHFPTIQAVEWAPRVLASERTAFETAQARDLPQFAITERGGAPLLRVAADSASYYPVTYVEPLAANGEALGFDLASDVARLTAIETAFASGTVTATAPIRLVQEHSSQWGMLLVHAVNDGASRPGVVLVVLRMGDFVGAVIGENAAAIGVRLIDRDSSGTVFDTLTDPRAGQYEHSFAFGTRYYIVRTAPTAAYLAAHQGWQSWAVLVGGVLSTALLGALLMLATGQSHRFEQLVKERTRDLEASHERLRQSQKLEALGQLTGGIAHDFNNLLTVIAGNLALLRGRVSGERERQIILAAERGAERGAKLTQSLLAFARRQVLRPELVAVDRIIGEFEPLLRQAAGVLVDLEFRLATGSEQCLVDTSQLQATMLNLVTNARDAMKDTGGRITIETACIELAEDPVREIRSGRYLMMGVSDTGHGMSAAVAARAFEPFYTTKTVGEGSGLGLSQVYGFARQSRGFVQLASAEGAGTTVRLYLPRAEATAPAHADDEVVPGSPPAETRGETVLIVDDEPDVRALLADMVRDLGYRVITADDGPSALALIDAGASVDLLLSDYAMPHGMTGDILVRAARERRRSMKALLISGFATSARQNRIDGVTVLEKPCRQSHLAQAIREALLAE